MSNKLTIYEESGTMSKYLIGYDPVISNAKSGLITMYMSNNMDIIIKDSNIIWSMVKPKYRKLAKRRTRFMKEVKKYAKFYKNVKLIK